MHSYSVENFEGLLERFRRLASEGLQWIVKKNIFPEHPVQMYVLFCFMEDLLDNKILEIQREMLNKEIKTNVIWSLTECDIYKPAKVGLENNFLMLS